MIMEPKPNILGQVPGTNSRVKNERDFLKLTKTVKELWDN